MTRNVANRFVRTILRSPFHWLLSRWVMLIAVTGRRTGRTYSTPVQYIRRDGTLYAVSRRERTWWRNVRGGAPATVRLRGQELQATGDVLDGPAIEPARGDIAGTWVEKALNRRPDTVLVRITLE